ncbi:MAG: DNA recombination protein RmuC [Prevotella sp.]|nr:DNA recombination protein RmuC [Prevotella sp.]
MDITTLLIIIALLIALFILIYKNQQNAKKSNERNSTLSNDVSAKQREIEMLNEKLEENQQQFERQLNDKNGQFEKQLAEKNELFEKQLTEKDNQYEKLLNEKDAQHEKLLNDKKEQYEKLLHEKNEQHEKLLNEKETQYSNRIAELNQRNEQEKTERIQLLEKQFAERLQLLQEQLNTTTRQLLEKRSEELDATNRAQMGNIIEPLKAVMGEMKKSMDDNRDSFMRSTTALSEQFKQMQTITTNLGDEAKKLSKALQTGPKVQGDFGEMKLNDLLDRFGFTKGIEYDVQYTMRDANGKVIRNDDTNDMMRPDVVLHYPDNKDVIIDSKASLTAFINYVNADNDEERNISLKEHVKSVRKHIDELAAKNYNKYSMEGRTTLDFVIMFVPQEAAMQLAITADIELWKYAFDKNVIITGEQNLFSLLRLLQIAWTQKQQTDNQEKVFDLASTIVDRVGLFCERFDKIGKNIDSIQKSYDDAGKSLNGKQSILSSANNLKKMGAKENKNRPLPKLETDDNELSVTEL